MIRQYPSPGRSASDLGRSETTIESAARAFLSGSPSADAEDAAGVACLVDGRPDRAAEHFEAALRADPEHVHARLHSAVVHHRRGRLDLALLEYGRAMRLHLANPGAWPPSLDREVASLGLLAEARHPRLAYAARRDHARTAPAPLVTVIVGCYGPFPHYSLRALDSVAAGEHLKLHCDLLIGLNDCVAETRHRARALIDDGIADGLVESRHNLNKDPILRVLREQVRTPYILWMDDDSHFTSADWPEVIAAMVASEHPFDVGGQAARWGPERLGDPEYAEFIRARPWWREPTRQPPALREWCPFVPGGMFLARTEFLRRHDFPDRGMIKAMDDVALGELVLQVGGRTVYWEQEVLDRVKISDGDRRGENVELADGWNRCGRPGTTLTDQ